MLDVKYPPINKDGEIKISEDLRKLVYRTLNYSLNRGNVLSSQKIWTGNLYKTDRSQERGYALVINPECDLAQNKHLYFKVAYGFEKNEISFPKEYDVKAEKVPLLPFRAGKNKNKQWKSHSDLKNLSKLNDHTSLLHFASENEQDIFIDFRDVASLEEKEFKNWKLLLRINDPFITMLTDTYSNLFNRKGLLPILS